MNSMASRLKVSQMKTVRAIVVLANTVQQTTSNWIVRMLNTTIPSANKKQLDSKDAQ